MKNVSGQAGGVTIEKADSSLYPDPKAVGVKTLTHDRDKVVLPKGESAPFGPFVVYEEEGRYPDSPTTKGALIREAGQPGKVAEGWEVEGYYSLGVKVAELGSGPTANITKSGQYKVRFVNKAKDVYAEFGPQSFEFR